MVIRKLSRKVPAGSPLEHGHNPLLERIHDAGPLPLFSGFRAWGRGVPSVRPTMSVCGSEGGAASGYIETKAMR